MTEKGLIVLIRSNEIAPSHVAYSSIYFFCGTDAKHGFDAGLCAFFYGKDLSSKKKAHGR